MTCSMWRAVRPKAILEGGDSGGKVEETKQVDFVEMNLPLVLRGMTGSK
jgi:hypothetical protein